MTERVRGVHPHLHSQLFGVERPPLGVARVAEALAQQGKLARFARDALLQVVAGHALVEGDGGQEPARILGRVAQVDPVDRRPRPIQGAGGVVAGRPELGLLGDTADHQPGLRGPAEPLGKLGLHGLDLGVQRLDDRRLGLIGVREEELGVLEHGAHPLADRAAGQALGLHQPVRLRREVGHQIEPQLVHLGGGRVRGGVGLQRKGVVGAPVRQTPDPGVVHRPRPPGLDQLHLAQQGRPDRLVVDAGRLLAMTAADPQRLQPPVQRSQQDGRFGGLRLQSAHLSERPIDREIGRDDPQPLVVPGDLDLLVELPGEAFHAGQVGVRVRLDHDLVLVGHEVGNGLVGAGDLADDVGGIGPAPAIGEAPVGLVGHRQRRFDRVVVHGVHAEEGVPADLAQPVELAGRQRLGPRVPRERGVPQFGLGPGQFARIEPKAGGGLRLQPQVLRHEGVHQGLEPGRLGGVGRPRGCPLGGGQGWRHRGGARGGGASQQQTAIDHGARLRGGAAPRKLQAACSCCFTRSARDLMSMGLGRKVTPGSPSRTSENSASA